MMKYHSHKIGFQSTLSNYKFERERLYLCVYRNYKCVSMTVQILPRVHVSKIDFIRFVYYMMNDYAHKSFACCVAFIGYLLCIPINLANKSVK